MFSCYNDYYHLTNWLGVCDKWKKKQWFTKKKLCSLLKINHFNKYEKELWKKSYESDISPNKYIDKLLLITNDRFTPF